MSDTVESLEKSTLLDKMKVKITGTIGYLLPLIASIPPMTVWGGLMTVPFAIYLLMMLFNLVENPPLPNLLDPFTLVTIAIQLFAIVFLLWSIVHLRRSKSNGLVISGPYQVVRHPQYLGLIILTFLMTLQSIWILSITFGIGWLSIGQTKMLWIIMLAVYAIIAKIEESHLKSTFSSKWTEYKSSVGFLFPFIKFKSDYIEMIMGILIPYAILEIVLFLIV